MNERRFAIDYLSDESFRRVLRTDGSRWRGMLCGYRQFTRANSILGSIEPTWRLSRSFAVA